MTTANPNDADAVIAEWKLRNDELIKLNDFLRGQNNRMTSFLQSIQTAFDESEEKTVERYLQNIESLLDLLMKENQTQMLTPEKVNPMPVASEQESDVHTFPSFVGR